MTREVAIAGLKAFRKEFSGYEPNEEMFDMAIKALEQEPCEDVISRKSIKQKLQEHHDFFVNAYGGFSNLPQNMKSRVDEITNCIAMVVNEPSVTPQNQVHPLCEDCHTKMDEVRRAYDNAMKQEPIIDKIRAEIRKKINFKSFNEGYVLYDDIIEVFDKYKAESEG